jgi:Ser/Thr protein kinase RdoA (MazF antagonist)
VDLARRVAKLVGTTNVREIRGGHQSRVFEVARSGRRMVVKVHDASTVDRVTLNTRVETIAELAAIDDQVCGPAPLEGRLVTTLDGDDGWVGLVTCYGYADGNAPNAASLADATLMGNSLARLHRSMRRIGQQALPLVAALDTVQPEWAGHVQLLHGDFNAGNVRIADGVTRIFDFDDCGYGPPTFDVANALYMVLFDDLTRLQPPVYRAFAEAFVSGYCGVTEQTLDTDDVSRFIDLRVTALQSWLDEPDTAPIGIRNSPPSWHATLRAFVSDYQDQRH